MQELQSTSKEITLRVGRNIAGPAPAISVVIPAYNTAEYICETLESVFAQTFSGYEIIVVNDGSPDTQQLERMLDKHLDDIIYIKQSNAGAGVARNTAIEHARGEIIAFLDGDDVWFPDFLASQHQFLETNGYDMVYCDAELFGVPFAGGKTFMNTSPSKGPAEFNRLLDLRCNVITSGTIARKPVIAAAGMFEAERVQAEDFHLWLRMAQSGAKIGYQRKPLLKYRVRLDSLSGDSVSRMVRAIEAFKRVRRTIELNEEQQEIVNRRISGFEADLAVEHGKSFLLDGNFQAAVDAFLKANRHRKSLKLTAISILARIAPRTLVKFYRSRRPVEIAFVPNSENQPD